MPRVSIVIPIYNEAARLPKLIDALCRQTYPRELIQYCLVDNNSTDGTQRIICENGIAPLVEDQVQNADAARNRALRAADGDVLAFTDADCLPDPDWIAAGVNALLTTQADLIAGKIVLTSPSRTPSAGELYDMVTNLRHDLSVAQRRVAFTANLFVRKSVIDQIGGFKPHCGGDHEFTSDAVHAGYRIEYASQAIVRHPARTTRELMMKGFRIGREKGIAHARATRRPTAPAPRPHFAHLNPWALRASLRSRVHRVSFDKFVRCYLVGCAYICAGMLGVTRAKLLPHKADPVIPKLST